MDYENKTLEELDGENWGKPNYDSYVVSNCHRLRRVPLKDLSVEDLRLMIGQDIGLRYLIPLALVQLEDDPFVEGDLYPGDLLKSVLGTSHDFWDQHPSLLQRMNAVVVQARTLIGACTKHEEIDESLEKSLNAFFSGHNTRCSRPAMSNSEYETL